MNLPTRCAARSSSRAGSSSRTASPTTCTPTRRAPTAPGRSIRCRSCCRRRSGRPSRPASPSAPGCSTRCSRTCTASSGCWPKGTSRRSCCSATLTTSGPATASGRPTAHWLNVYAADLARAPDGRWWLLADRTQAPSGAGYALENREILEQVHPEAFPTWRCAACAASSTALRDRMYSSQQEWAAGDESPLAVMLTPGPYNETYFEHAYLAR